MPFEESTTTPGQMNALAREAHLIRTKDRIADWRNRLQDNPSDDLKEVALEELTKYERQLREPLTARTLRATPVVAQSPLDRLVHTLQTEVMELKAKLMGQPTASSAKTEELVAHGA